MRSDEVLIAESINGGGGTERMFIGPVVGSGFVVCISNWWTGARECVKIDLLTTVMIPIFGRHYGMPILADG